MDTSTQDNLSATMNTLRPFLPLPIFFSTQNRLPPASLVFAAANKQRGKLALRVHYPANAVKGWTPWTIAKHGSLDKERKTLVIRLLCLYNRQDCIFSLLPKEIFICMLEFAVEVPVPYIWPISVALKQMIRDCSVVRDKVDHTNAVVNGQPSFLYYPTRQGSTAKLTDFISAEVHSGSVSLEDHLRKKHGEEWQDYLPLVQADTVPLSTKMTCNQLLEDVEHLRAAFANDNVQLAMLEANYARMGDTYRESATIVKPHDPNDERPLKKVRSQ